MKSTKLFTCFLTVFFVSTFAFAQEIMTPSVISDNMVLKRNSSAKIWGWAKANQNMYIVADWNVSDTVRFKCDQNSRFEAEIKTPEAGGPYAIKIVSPSDEKTINNLLIGEVWLCSGQSNMQMSMSSLYGTKVDYHEKFAKLDNPQIRMMFVPLVGAEHPQIDCRAQWKECKAENMSNVSLTAYFFAEKLQKELNMPVGIVMSSWGGTNAEVWISEQATLQSQDVQKSYEAGVKKVMQPSVLYNGMIAPLVPFTFSGTIWYQGEANVVNNRYYDSVMRTLINSWRGDFGKKMPFYFVQIAPFTYKGMMSPYLREQQYFTSQHENCGMVVINDLVDNVKNIHPKNKVDVGARLADLALYNDYGFKNIDCNYPEVASVTPENNKLILKLENCEKGAYIVDKNNCGFKIADEDGHFVDATAKIDGNIVTLSAKGVKNPVYVRYLFEDAAVCGVKGNNGLPLIPYRNDKF